MTNSHTLAMLLAGGRGTRLRAVVSDRPKSMADVAGRPFLDFLLEQLCEAGLRRVILCTGHLGHCIEHTYGDAYGSLSLEYSREAEALGTAGAIRNALRCLRGQRSVLVLNGDSYADVKLRSFIDWYQDKPVTGGALIVAKIVDCARFGTVEVDGTDRIVAFREKRGVHEPGWINAGVYMLETDSIRAWSSATPLSLERDVIPRQISEGVRGFRMNGKFIDIGIPESYSQVVSFMQQRRLA